MNDPILEPRRTQIEATNLHRVRSSGKRQGSVGCDFGVSVFRSRVALNHLDGYLRPVLNHAEPL